MTTRNFRVNTGLSVGDIVAVASTNAVRQHLERLAKKGFIERNENISRGIKIIGNRAGRSIPLVENLQVPFSGLSDRDKVESIGQIAVGAEFSIDFSPTPVYLKDDVISLVTTQENLDKTTTTYDVSIKIIELFKDILKNIMKFMESTEETDLLLLLAMSYQMEFYN